MYCSQCGKYIPDGSTECSYCGTSFQQSVAFDGTPQPAPQPEKRENIVTGIVGAVLGAAIGAASIILVARLGFVAALCGIILAVCTFKGYEMLGGKLSSVGIIICILLILVTPYIADRIDWAIVLVRDVGIDFGQAFQMIPELIEEELIDSGDYWMNLGKLYAFTIIGAISNIVSVNKKS